MDRHRYQRASLLQGSKWSDHMVLVRSSFAARHIEAACIAANVPYRFIGGMKLLETAHVKDLLSLLRVVANPLDDIAWMRFLTLWNGVGDVGASKLSQQLLAEPEMDIIADKLEKFGKIPLESILIMKQMAVLKQKLKPVSVWPFKPSKTSLLKTTKRLESPSG